MLVNLLIFSLLLILLWSMWQAYRTTADPLHPLMYLAPLFVYTFVFKPFWLGYQGLLEVLFDSDQLLEVQIVMVLGVTAFCLGALRHAEQVKHVRSNANAAREEMEQLVTPAVRRRAVEIAWALGGLAVAAYWIMIYRAGGLSAVYGQSYGGVISGSGYLGELPLLTLAAIGMLHFARSGQPFTATWLAELLIFASPMIVHGFLGARRGPTFMVIAALLVGGYAVSRRRPKLLTVFAGTFLLGLLMLFLVQNRDRIFLDASALEEWDTVRPMVADNVNPADDWVFSGGMILTSQESDTHYWGTRLLVNLVIHPIPRQLWPGKYADTGFGWMETREEMGGMPDAQWVATTGWIPRRGSAAGFVADLFLEFSWLGLGACYVFGWLYSYLWKRSVVDGGEWSIVYLFCAILSVYVPTQSVSAWAYRFVFLSIPTFALWHLFVKPEMNMTRALKLVRTA